MSLVKVISRPGQGPTHKQFRGPKGQVLKCSCGRIRPRGSAICEQCRKKLLK